MKKFLKYFLITICIFAVGCSNNTQQKSTDKSLLKNLNLKVLNMAGKKDAFKELEPDTIQPNDFYNGKFDSSKYNVISLDQTTIDRFKKDNKTKLLFDKNFVYIVKNKTSNIKEMYNELQGIEANKQTSAALTLYRVYENEIKIIELKENESSDTDSILFILNQLYHTKSRAEFDEWYLSFLK